MSSASLGSFYTIRFKAGSYARGWEEWPRRYKLKRNAVRQYERLLAEYPHWFDETSGVVFVTTSVQEIDPS